MDDGLHIADRLLLEDIAGEEEEAGEEENYRVRLR